MLKQVGPFRLRRELRSDVLTAAHEAARNGGDERVTVIVGKSPVKLAPEDLEIFRVEAEATGALPEALVDRVIDHGVQHGMPWVAHPWVESWSLAEKLADIDGGLPGSAVAVIGSDVATALRAAQEVEPPLLHRGISVHSVVLDGELRARVSGFALAGVALDGARKSPALARMVKREGAPELATGAPLTPAVDLFALGVVLFTLLHGEPFAGGAAKLAGADVGGMLSDSLPSDLRALIGQLLAEDPAARGTADEAAERLRRCVSDPDAEREGLGLLFGIEPITTKDAEVAPEVPEGAPPMGVALDDVTKETNLKDALAAMAPSRPASPATEPPPPRVAPGEDEPTLPPSPSERAFAEDPPTIISANRAYPPAEDATARTGAPQVEEDDFFEGPTVVRSDGGTELLDAPNVGAAAFPPPPGAPPSDARTKQLDLSEVGHARSTVPEPEDFAPPPSPLQRWLEEQSKVEVGGWPLPWIVGVGAGAFFLVLIAMVMGIWLAS